ncbi:MAG: hypothetical protein Q8Q63_09260, partial [Phaeovulum sp.]|uniref:hypothetical protein n=1 Tax=Phaeovulum sp. TaxID=2934796 RepID=UPI002732A3F9
ITSLLRIVSPFRFRGLPRRVAAAADNLPSLTRRRRVTQACGSGSFCDEKRRRWKMRAQRCQIARAQYLHFLIHRIINALYPVAIPRIF